jgi:putative chromate ion transporter
LQQGVVQQFGWLNEHQFLDAVAVAMITPGPVVITVAFIGLLVAGLAGAIMAAIGIFLPVYLFTIIPAPWFKRHRDNPQLKAFVHGATAAATGAITGAVIVLGARAITGIATRGHRACKPGRLVAVEDLRTDSGRRFGASRIDALAVGADAVTSCFHRPLST